jgi:diguanylate cyclase (GGDEF)-like protein
VSPFGDRPLREDLLSLLASTTGEFIVRPASEVDTSVDRTLTAVGRLFGVDRAYVFLFDDVGESMSNTHEWCAEGISAQRDELQGVPVSLAPWWMGELHAGRPINLRSLDDLPPEATGERAILEPQQIRSLLVLPMSWRGHLDGFVGFDHVRSERTWNDEEIAVLRIVTSTFAQGFERRRLDAGLREQEARLEQMAFYDALTKLPNRALLADRMEQALSQMRRSGRMLAVCYLDLDTFKPVNDLYGHDAGDRLLVETGHRLTAALRSGDTVARLGGDEFVVLLPGLASARECEHLVDRMLRVVADPFEVVPGSSVALSASAGVRLVPPDDADPDTLLRQADRAMYAAKQEGRGRSHLFDAAHDREVLRRREQVARIVAGLRAGEMEVHYQPVVELASGRLRYAEALVRWHHPERGLLPPGEWLPSILDHESVAALGDWVLETVLAQSERWRADGLCGGASVNVSAYELRNPSFAGHLALALARHPGMPRGTLRLEVLESAALPDMAAAGDVMRACAALGVEFSLDDFGTGYSSLTYLKRLPASTIKIDRSFVSGMLSDPGDRAIVLGVIGLARVFGREAVAEGVETPAHIAALREAGCALGQGYGIAPAMPAERFEAWARSHVPGSYTSVPAGAPPCKTR